jgi:hypothetical protein
MASIFRAKDGGGSMFLQNVGIYLQVVGFEVLTAVSTKMAVFCVVSLCSLVVVFQRLRGAFGLSPGGW